jgi:mannose-6-phosphate isomerase-like protein (cupin superfamily)
VGEAVSTTTIDWDSDERFVSLRRALGVTGFGLNQITLQPRQRGRIHRHSEQEEVYLVLAGVLTVAFEDGQQELRAGALMRVPPEIRRQLVNLGAEPCVIVAMGAAGGYVGRDGEAFEDWAETPGRTPQDVPLPEDLPA